MITEIVSFKIKPGMTRADVLEQAKGTLDRWRANPDLLQKSYVMPDDHSAMGIYLWTSKDAA